MNAMIYVAFERFAERNFLRPHKLGGKMAGSVTNLD
jgi:hypothetical protein